MPFIGIALAHTTATQFPPVDEFWLLYNGLWADAGFWEDDALWIDLP